MVVKKLLRDSHPELRAQFNETLNAGVAFDDLFVIFNEKVFWTCPQGHLIHQKPRLRTQGKCLPCSYDKSRKYLKDYHKQLLSEFARDDNEGVDPETLYSRSQGTYVWVCLKSGRKHTYRATVKARIMGHACPYCAGMEILPGFNDWMTLEPLQDLLWDYEKNVYSDGRQIDPSTFGLDNRTKFHWICLTGNHERVISISSAIQGQRLGKVCRTCSGYKCLPGLNDALTLFPHLRDRISPEANFDLDLTNLHPGDRETLITWICENKHTWTRSVAEELRSKGCGKCSGKELWQGHNDLQSQFPDLADQIAYDLNKDLVGFVQVPPMELHMNSSLDSWWRCREHSHTWRTKVEKRTREGTGCPFCSDRRVWTGFNDLWTKRPDLVDEIDFDKEPGLDPKKLLWVSHDEINWICSEGHKWSAALHLRSSNSNRTPTGCPNCAVSGFKPDNPGIIYFIENADLLAYKVGITNAGTQRLSSWLGQGWKLIEKYEFTRGAEARYVETRFHFWRRNVLLLSDFLSREDVGRMGGWTETFNNQSLTTDEVKQKIQELIDQRSML